MSDEDKSFGVSGEEVVHTINKLEIFKVTLGEPEAKLFEDAFLKFRHKTEATVDGMLKIIDFVKAE